MNFLNSEPCKNQDCLFLHEYSSDDYSMTKEDLSSNKSLFVEQQKRAHYAPWLQARQMGSFLPLAAETFGCFGRSLQSFLSQCGQAHATRAAGVDAEDGVASGFTQCYRQRISVTLQRAQAQAFRQGLVRLGHPDPEMRRDHTSFVQCCRDMDLHQPMDLLDAATVEME